MNKLIRIKEMICATFVLGLILPASVARSEVTRSVNIVKWEELTAPKGFILSNYLYHNQNCALIWERQLPAFQEKNPHVEDPDVIMPGTKIIVQSCKDSTVIAEEESSEAPINSAEQLSTELAKEETIYKAGDPYIHLFAGFLTENEKYEQIDSAYGIGVTGDLSNHIGYNIQLLGGKSVAFFQNEVMFKTMPAEYRWFLIVGLANRLGFQNKDLNRLNKGVDSFSYAGIGGEIHSNPKYKFNFDITTNLGVYKSVNLGVSAQKRFGQDLWFGMYGEAQSSQSSEDEKGHPRNYLSGGLKLSF